MSETYPTEPTSAAEIPESSADLSPESDAAEQVPGYEPASHAKDSSASLGSKWSRWAPVAALVLAVVATSVAVVGWFFPHTSASSAPTYTDQQTKDAKTHLCTAFMLVDRAVVRNTHLKSSPEGGPVGQFAVATSARLALYGGGAYLRDQVNINPATPANLAKSANALSTTLQELGIGYLAGAQEFTQTTLRQNLDAQVKATAEQCK